MSKKMAEIVKVVAIANEDSVYIEHVSYLLKRCRNLETILSQHMRPTHVLSCSYGNAIGDEGDCCSCGMVELRQKTRTILNAGDNE